MCNRLFIASDHPLPLLPAHLPGPLFGTCAVDPDLVATLPIPAGWQVVDTVSTSHCGCDFFHEEGSHRRWLAEYLRPLAGRQRLLLYSTWWSDEALPATTRPALTVDDLCQDGDPIPQQTLTPIL
jgi:hypothetical protein